MNEADALTDDDASAGLDDREFTVRAVHRQLNGEAVPTLHEVRAIAAIPVIKDLLGL